MNPFIDLCLLDEVSAEAQDSLRLRKNRNFHGADDAACHRLLNAIEPGTYIIPHRHMDPAKEETMIVLRGRMGLVFFDDGGRVTLSRLLSAQGETRGVNIPPGTYHSLVALESGTVFFEAKAGPYRPLTNEERASWAPTEGEPPAADYLVRLASLFS